MLSGDLYLHFVLLQFEVKHALSYSSNMRLIT